LEISLAAYLDGHFFFVISHSEIIENQAIFQKYKIDKVLKELNYVSESEIPYIKSSLPKQIPSLPYFAVSWQTFLDLKDDHMRVVSLIHPPNMPEDLLYEVNPYSEKFINKLLTECKA
jgi:hypothetical protein